MKTVTIADYGVGNLQSVARAIEFCGATPVVTSDSRVIAKADRFLLPGVGAFQDGMKGLSETGVLDGILEFAQTGRPFLGICLGMQMLMDSSLEFGHNDGLGLIHGTCVSIPTTSTEGVRVKVPHIGWSELAKSPESPSWSQTIFADVNLGEEVYFVHSWMVQPIHSASVLAVTQYGGHQITAALQENQYIGCQFHPEKSGPTGLKIISSFLKM